MPTRRLLPAWYMKLPEETLVPGSFLTNEAINNPPKPRKPLKHTYLSGRTLARLQKDGRTIEHDTLFLYPTGKHGDEVVGDKIIAGIYLKRVIKPEAQEEALRAMEAMKWHGPTRKETKTAVERQKKNSVTPGELTIGVVHPQHKPHLLMPSRDFKRNREHMPGMDKLFNELEAIFARTLPIYFRIQNDPKPLAVMDEEGEEVKLPYAGIPDYLRRWDPRSPTRVFSTVSLLRSCPASIHKDRNANKDQHNFACLTSIGERDKKGQPKFSGGRFCLIEYGLRVPILPGDVFIGQTTREWHYNVDPVIGKKYSVICYFHPREANPKKDHSSLDLPKDGD